MTDEPKRKLMVGDHPVSPFGRTEAYADDEYWQEAAKRLQDERDTLAAALREAQERVAQMREALRQAEWGDLTSDGWGKMIERCPVCDHQRENGHKADCILAAALMTPEEARDDGQ